MARNTNARRTNKGELLARMSQATSEIRYVKEQQFRTIYYSLLLFSAVIALFQINVEIPISTYRVLKIICIAIVWAMFRQSSSIQWDHFKAIGEYREGLEHIENQLQPNMGKSTRSESRKRARDWIAFILLGKELPGAKAITTAKDKVPSSKRYTWMFISLTFLAVSATTVVLIFDK